jgi:hypothetical protein
LIRGATREHFLHELRAPRAPHEPALGDGRSGCGLDDRDHFVDVGERDGEAFEHMGAIARLAQVVHRAPRDHLAAVAQERFQELLQVEQPRLAVDERDHVHAERLLHRRELVEIVQHDLRHFAALQLDDSPHARLVGFVAQVRDALDALLAHELADLDEELRLVHLVGQLVDDDRLALALADFLHVRARAHDDAPATGEVSLLHFRDAIDDSRRREVRRGDDLHEIADGQVGVLQQRRAGIHDLAQVVRRDVRRHADRDARRAVDQEIWKLRGKDERLRLAPVVVGTEVHRFLVEIGEQLVRDLRHADLGVAHGRGVVAVDRSEVSLAVDQRITQAEVLRHAHDRVVHRGVAVRMVLADHVADDARRFLVRLVPVVRQLVHGVQDASMHGFEAVTDIGERAPHDHAHGVIEVGAFHLLLEADGVGFSGELFHGFRVGRSPLGGIPTSCFYLRISKARNPNSSMERGALSNVSPTRNVVAKMQP